MDEAIVVMTEKGLVVSALLTIRVRWSALLLAGDLRRHVADSMF